jgi:hypothetical protein
MYHDTIHINFIYNRPNDISFDYSFSISKEISAKFSPIKYQTLLDNFEQLGFNIKYLKFNDIDDLDTTVFCSFNYQPNHNIFFKSYPKVIQNKPFDILFLYGNLINGIFIPNNINTSAGISFKNCDNTSLYKETVIKGIIHEKIKEMYQVIDKEGHIIATETVGQDIDFQQNFFQRYEVKVALRKYKLGRLNLFRESEDSPL